MKGFTARAICAAMSAAFLLAACKGGGQSSTFKIGIVTSLTGPNAAFGQAHKNAYTLALSELNAKGGVLGKPIELLYYDDQSKPDQGVQGVAKLVDLEQVPIILGAYSSEITRAMVQAVTPKQVPLLIPTAVADNLMETGSQWIFRLCVGSGAYARATLDFLQNNGTPKTMAIVYENTNFGQSNDKSMREEAAKAGITVVAEEAYQASSPDYKALLHRVKATNPEVVYFGSYLLDATTLVRQSAEVGLNPRYYTAAGNGFSAAEFPTNDKGAGKYAEYTFSVNQWHHTAKWPGSKEFDEAFYNLTGTHPTYHAMEAYATLLVAAAAIEKAGRAQPAAIRDALRALDLPATPFGPVKFDARGQNAHPVLITQIQKGQFRVVWPPSAAETPPIIPTPPWSKRL
jgi:branched-chain amino acid transport system substrate-binding protein